MSKIQVANMSKVQVSSMSKIQEANKSKVQVGSMSKMQVANMSKVQIAAPEEDEAAEDRKSVAPSIQPSSMKQAQKSMADFSGLEETGKPRKKNLGLPTYTKSDSSIYPTYSHLDLPDRVICRQRYQNAINTHHAQFIKEIKLHEKLQPYALGGVRLRREFCDPILVKVSNKDIISLNMDEERRLEYILVKNGHIRRIVDEEVKSLVLEIAGTNVATTYITCPIKPRASLGIKLPFLVMVVKNMKKYFTFEIQIIDDKDMRRRFRVSNFQSTTKVRPFCTTMPIGLSSGWNQIQFNLADFTRRAYGTVYMETIRVQIHANVRIRRIYFSDRLYSEEELPSEYKLFMPLQKTKDRDFKKGKSVSKEVGLKTKVPSGEKVKEVEPSGAPPTPAEPTDDHIAEEEREVGSTSVEPGAGDVAQMDEVDTERGDGEGDDSVAAPPPSASHGDEEGEAEETEADAAEGEPAEGEADEAPVDEGGEPPAEEGAEQADAEPADNDAADED